MVYCNVLKIEREKKRTQTKCKTKSINSEIQSLFFGLVVVVVVIIIDSIVEHSNGKNL